jgi:hypothetical protein
MYSGLLIGISSLQIIALRQAQDDNFKFELREVLGQNL